MHDRTQLVKVGAAALVIVGTALLWKFCTTQLRKKRKSAVISKLIIYPIKSCKGVEVTRAKCTALGLMFGDLRDRQYMVADAETGALVSGRTHPLLVLATTRIDEISAELCVSAPGMEELRIPLGKPRQEVVVHGNVFDAKVSGLDCGKAASDWFSKYLTSSVKLIYFDLSSFVRPVEPLVGNAYNRHSRPNAGNARTMYADGYPYLLCNELSVDQINKDIGEQVTSWENFRPNILVSATARPYIEDEWRAIEINGVDLFGEKPCGRCSFPNVNPKTAVKNPKAEPFNTLYKTRLLKQYNKSSPMFGMNLVLDGVPGYVSVGDSVMC